MSDDGGGAGDNELIALAAAARDRAYAPYSRFRVGAAVRCASGKAYAGCNVENATYGATVCAERNAVAAAIVAGECAIETVAVVTDAATPTPPCGICRQVLREFRKDVRIISVAGDGRRRVWGLPELLPESFGPEDLQ